MKNHRTPTIFVYKSQKICYNMKPSKGVKIMKNDTRFRITRIILIMCFLLVGTYLRNNLIENYQNADKISNNITNNLKVENIETKQEEGGYILKITNYGNKEKNFTIALITDRNNTIPNENIKYTVIKDNKVIITDNLNKQGYLTNQTLKDEQTSIYKIKFWVDQNKNNINGTFSSKIALI